MAEPLCQVCGDVVQIIYDILKSGEPGNFSYGTVETFEESAAQGCRFCALISNGFKNSGYDFPTFRFWFQTGLDSEEGSLVLGFLEVWTATLNGRETCHFEVERKPGDFQIPIQADPSSKWVLEVAQKWLGSCIKEHDCAEGDDHSLWLPSRLLDLGTPKETYLRLVMGDEVSNASKTPSEIRYTALSHCWGPDPSSIPRTLLASLDERKRGIALESLSKTFRDFVAITRALGIRYAWIDSLCIIQNSEMDWQLQCAQMHKVYSHACCTICASDSSDGSGGCFIKRERSEINEVEFGWGAEEKKHFIREKFASLNIFKVKRDPSTVTIVPFDYLKIYPYFAPLERAISGPLAARAWTLQERELSPRIIHFTKHRILWECRRCVASEEFQDLSEKSQTKKKYRGVFEHSALRTFDGDVALKSRYPQNPHLAWQSLVEDYSRRELTDKKDRLPALSALAARFSQLNQCSNYVAGVWAENLLPGLCWFPVLEEKNAYQTWPPLTTYPGVPSWSWAAFAGPVKHYGNDWFIRRWKEVVPTIETPPSTNKQSLDPFGGIAGGEIHLTGWAMEVTLSEENHKPDAFSQYEKTSASSVDLGFAGDVVGYVGKPRLRHPSAREAGISMVSTGYMDKSGHFQVTGFYGDESEPDYRPKNLVDLTSRPPKGYITLQSHELPSRSMCVMFDANPIDLPETKFLCFQLGKGKSPWPLSGMPTENGLVLLRTDNKERAEYRRVGMFAAERDDPIWRRSRQETTVFVI